MSIISLFFSQLSSSMQQEMGEGHAWITLLYTPKENSRFL